MTVVCREGLDSASRKVLMLVLSLEDRNKNREMDNVHIQKIVRFFEYLTQRNDIDYTNYNYGTVSEDIDENLESLQEYGYVQEVNGKYTLTDEGNECINVLTEVFGEGDLRKLSFAKKQLNNLEFWELLFFMYKLIPQSIENSTVYAKLERNRLPLTISLFKKGCINSDTAAKWLCMTEKEFLDYLTRQS
jgi:hypothetical protein